MTYWLLNAAFLAVVAAVTVIAVVVCPGRGMPRATFLAMLGGTLVVVLALTAVFDNVMIAVGLVAYDPAALSGVFVGIAPVEDFAYAVAAALLLPSLWVLLTPQARRGARG